MAPLWQRLQGSVWGPGGTQRHWKPTDLCSPKVWSNHSLARLIPAQILHTRHRRQRHNTDLVHLREQRKESEDDLWKNTQPVLFIWQGVCFSPTVGQSSKSVCQWTKSEQIYLVFSLATPHDSHTSSTVPLASTGCKLRQDRNFDFSSSSEITVTSDINKRKLNRWPSLLFSSWRCLSWPWVSVGKEMKLLINAKRNTLYSERNHNQNESQETTFLCV